MPVYGVESPFCTYANITFTYLYKSIPHILQFPQHHEHIAKIIRAIKPGQNVHRERMQKIQFDFVFNRFDGVNELCLRQRRANCLFQKKPGASLLRCSLMALTCCTTSKSRALPPIPYDFKEGETARQIVFSVRETSATTRLVVRGLRPLSTHSTEA